jgi:membrane protein YqaA with SNARE-associated domain
VLDQAGLWFLVWGMAVAINVVPAFMPPTWALLVYFHVGHGLDVLPLAIVGAFGSTVGRALLALLSRAVGERIIPTRWRENITALATTLAARPAIGLSSLALFTLGPVPSNHLFIAAGLAHAPLAPILAFFAVARFASYVIWVNAASVAAKSLQDVLGPRFGGGMAAAMQIAGFVLLILIMQIDWATYLRRWSRRPDHGSERAGDSGP